MTRFRRSVVGLDIGTTSVRAVEAPARGRLALLRFGEVPLPAGAVAGGEIHDVDVVATAIAKLWREAGFMSKRAAIALANQKVVVREIPLPFMEEEELRAALRFHVEDYIPIPVDDAILDYQVLDESVDEEGARTLRVLVVAAHREMVAGFCSAVERAGIEPVAVDLAPFAAVRAVGAAAPDANGHAEALVDVGCDVTAVVVHRAGVPRFVRMIPAGSSEVTEALMTATGVTYEEAERRKAEVGLPPDGMMPTDRTMRVIAERAARLLDDIRDSLEYYQGQQGALPVGRVVAVGAGARMPRLADRLARVLNLPVEIGRPLSAFAALPVEDGARERLEAAAAVAVGLVLGERR